MSDTPRTDALRKRFERDCLASSAAGDLQKAVFEAGKFIDDIAESHERLERELAAARQRDTVVVPFSVDLFNKCAVIVGTMDGYDGQSPDADHFNWLNAMLTAAKESSNG